MFAVTVTISLSITEAHLEMGVTLHDRLFSKQSLIPSPHLQPVNPRLREWLEMKGEHGHDEEYLPVKSW